MRRCALKDVRGDISLKTGVSQTNLNGSVHSNASIYICGRLSITLKNAVEGHFTAKPQGAQRTYIKNKIHPFGEALDHTKLNSKPAFP